MAVRMTGAVRPGAGIRRPRSLFPCIVASGLLSVAACLAGAGRATAVVPMIRQVLLAGISADSLGSTRGAIFIFTPDPPGLALASAATGLVEPVAVASAPDRRLYVLDASADPLHIGNSFGSIWLVDPNAGSASNARFVATSPLFRRPADLLLEPGGTILVLDRDADPGGWGRLNGAIFRVDPATSSVSILAAPQVFSEPRSLAVDLDGTILVVDETANPLNLATPAGAIFRVNPRTGVVTLERAFAKPAQVAPAAVAVITYGSRRGDFLLVDREADPFGRGNRPGAVFYVPRSGGAPILFTDAQEFVEPVDILVGTKDDCLVLDRMATTAQAPSGKGAVFRFRLSDGLVLQSPKVSDLFRTLNSFVQLAGAELDSSTVVWTAASAAPPVPGDLFTVRARVRNTGTEDAPVVSLADILGTAFQFVPGSDSIGTGRSFYNRQAREFSWSGALARHAETTVRYRIRISDDAVSSVRLDQNVILRAGEAPTAYSWSVTPRREFGIDANLYLDIKPSGANKVGALYLVSTDSPEPELVRQGGLLQGPTDAVFLEDGRLAILDPASSGGDKGAVLVFSAGSRDTLSVLLALRGDMGPMSFVNPIGLSLDRNGALLITDRNANPYRVPYTEDPFGRPGDTGPGAVFRFDPVTRELSVALADSDFVEPVDAAMDRRGAIVVVDYLGGSGQQGTVWEFSPGGTEVRQIELDAGLFLTPVGIAVDAANDLYVSSFRSRDGPNPKGGAIYKISRGPDGAVTVASADSALREPVDLAVGPDGNVLVADRAANPFHFSGEARGSVFQLHPSTGELTVAAASAVMRAPSGVVALGWPDLAGSRFLLQNSGPGNPQPGDTVRAEVEIINQGLASSPHAMAVLTYDASTVRILPVDPPFAGLVVDSLTNRAAWTGRVAWADTVRFTVKGLVQPGNSYGTPAEVRLDVLGGRYPRIVVQTWPIRSDFVSGDLLLADRAADPNRVGRPVGGAFRLGPDASQGTRLVYSGSRLVGAAAIEWTANGDLLFAADGGDGPGQTYRFDTSTGEILQFGAIDTLLRTPVDMLLAPEGEILIVDREAKGPTPSSRGAIFSRIGDGPLAVYCADSRFRTPIQAAFGPDGMLYLADRDADPDGVGGNTGAVFTIDPATRKVVGWLQDPALPEPTGVIAYDDSTLLVTDPFGIGAPTPLGTLMLYRPRGRVLSLLFESGDLRSLWRTVRASTGELLLVDRDGQHAGQTGTGLVWGFDPLSRILREYAWSNWFAQLSDLAVKPGPVVRLARYEWTDVNGPPLHPADQVRFRAVLRNEGVLASYDTAYRDSVPDEATIIPETAVASGGAIGFDGSRVLTWSGSIPAGDSVVVSYNVQLNPAVSEGLLLVFHATTSDPSSGTSGRDSKLQTYVPLEPGHLYLVDAEADPYGDSGSGQSGVLFKINGTTGSVVPMLTSPLFRSPRSIALVGNSAAPRFLILDAQAPNQYQQPGTLYLFDPTTQELRNLGGHIAFNDPVKVLAWSDTEAFLLDAKADPDNLVNGAGSGPGAIFLVNLETAEITHVFSDTTLKMPASMAWLAPGILAISDQKVDLNGPAPGRGAVYRLDVSTWELRPFASSSDWRTPGAVCSSGEGGLLLVDRDATPTDVGGGYGSVFRISPEGQVSFLTVSPFFRGLNDVQAEPNGGALVADDNADPYGFGGAPGAILRWNPRVRGLFSPLASSRMFRNPSGFVAYGDPTPVELVEAGADSTGDGIRLRWRAGVDETGARWLIFRRQAIGPDDPGDAAPEGYDAVGGDREFRGPGPHEYLDGSVEGGRWYVYLLARVAPDGAVDYSVPLKARAPGRGVRLQLLPAVPSPFSASTSIGFLVPAADGRLCLAVFDVAGRRVRVLYDGPAIPGRQVLAWDGRDDAGRRLASGVYFARLSLGDDACHRRLVIMR